ncbi:MAG: PEGA domain-containing protein [Verrucomicrobia bacterium]|nr:PEGA domain-containing protein [Verrucomicrobiota bacterium]
MTLPADHRYRVRQSVGQDRLIADDIRLGVPVLMRKAGGGRACLLKPGWRHRVMVFTSLRHPNHLNILEVVRDGGQDFVVTECPIGPSLAEALRLGPGFSLEDVVKILPLTALDVTAAAIISRNGPAAAGMYVEPCQPGCRMVEAVGKPVSQWPPFLVKIDLWDLIQPGGDCRDRPGYFAGDRHLTVTPAVRYSALLTYELLGGIRSRQGARAGRRGFKPVANLSPEANALLRNVLQGRTQFTSSEEFLWALESANLTGQATRAQGGARTISVPTTVKPVSAAAKRPDRSSGKSTWFNARATAIAAGMVAAAVVLGAVVYEQWRESHPSLVGSPAFGLIRLQTEPRGAQISVDGTEVPAVQTAAFWEGRLAKGSHHILVSRAGFISKELDVQVAPERVNDLGTIALQPAYGKLSLTADVPETSYEVIGPNSERLTGSAPATLPQLGPGRYTVHLRPAGWPEYTETVEVLPGQTVSVDHAFSGAQNEQALTTTPSLGAKPGAIPGAEVDADDEDDASAKGRPHARAHRKAMLPRPEAFRRFEAEWDAKEQAIQAQIGLIDRRMSSATGSERERLKAQRWYLERRRDYVRDLRRYHRTQLRQRYGAPESLIDTLRNALGF